MTSGRDTCDVTVIIPAFNAASTLERAVRSVEQQILLPESVVIIIDTSTDETESIARSLEAENLPFKLTVISNTSNKGPGRSRNEGWDLATTKWVAFLDADDAWHPNKLNIQISWMENHPEIDMTATQTRLGISGDNFDSSNFSITTVTLKSIVFKNPIPTRSVVLKREIPNRFQAGLSEDLALWLELLRAGRQIRKIELPLAIHFRPEYSPGGASSKLLRQERFELRNLMGCFSEAPMLVPVAIIFSILKFFRRVVISAARKARS